MIKNFEKEYIVKYYNCGNDNKILFPELIRYTQEASTLHTTEVGCSPEYLIKNRIGWILLENHCKICEYPKVNETFKIRTWVNDIERLYAIRHYEITDSKENVILQSCTKWIMYSFEKARPIKVPDEIKNMYTYTDEKSINIGNVDFSQSGNVDKKYNDIVLYKDVDTNWHMNNVSYILSVMESMGKDFLDNNEVEECLIKYNHQLIYNTSFNISAKRISDNEYIYNVNEENVNDDIKRNNNADVYLKWRGKSESNNL